MHRNRKTKSARLIALAGAALALMALVACGGSGNNNSSTTPAASPGASSSASSGASASPAGTVNKVAECATAGPTIGLVSQAAVTGNGVYAPGQPIAVTLILANCGNNDATLYYPTTQRYNFHILDANGNELWSSADGKSYGQTEGTEAIAPQTEEKFTETWDQKDRNGAQVADGIYKVEAFSVGCAVAARSGCEFGPVRFVQIRATTATPPAG
jgi:hypothetical protein